MCAAKADGVRSLLGAYCWDMLLIGVISVIWLGFLVFPKVVAGVILSTVPKIRMEFSKVQKPLLHLVRSLVTLRVRLLQLW